MRFLSPLDALKTFRAQLPAQARLYIAGGSGEPLAVAKAFENDPSLAAGVTFLGIWIAGINTTNWASLHPTARMETTFLSASFRATFDAHQADFLPLSYTQAWPWLCQTPLDGAIIMVSPPDEFGQVSLGVSVDFSSAILARPDVPVMALINPAMRRPLNSPAFSLDRFTVIAEADTPLVQVPAKPLSLAFGSIAEHISGLVEHGDTLQFGVGNAQQAVLNALGEHRNLRIHSGMVSDPLLGLLDGGAVSDASDAITTGVAIGTDPLYARVSTDPRIRFRPVSHTHALAALSAIPNFKAINSAIEVDLFGQANAEFIGGKQISGTGGLVDFMRGAALASGGRAVTALTSTAKRGKISRIVARLSPNAISVTRADMDTVITEHGVANLKYCSVDQRAEALIEIADPAYRDYLSNAWDAIRTAM